MQGGGLGYSASSEDVRFCVRIWTRLRHGSQGGGGRSDEFDDEWSYMSTTAKERNPPSASSASEASSNDVMEPRIRYPRALDRE